MALTRSLKTSKCLLMPSWTRRDLRSWGLVGILAQVGLCLGGLEGTAVAQSKRTIKFDMVRSAAAQTGNRGCAAATGAA